MKNKLKRACLLFLIFAMLMGCFAIRGDFSVSASGLYAESGNVITPGNFRLSAMNVPKDSKGRIELSWDDLIAMLNNGDEYAYQYYQRQADGDQDFELRSTKYGKPIRVLNIYPANTATSTTGDRLQNWLSNTMTYTAPNVDARDRIVANGYGVRTGTGTNRGLRVVANPLDESNQPLITIEKVRQFHFNQNPDLYLKDTSGKYMYDVIVIGAYDINNSAPVNQLAKDAVEDFLKAGKGVLFCHDTLIEYADVRISKSTDANWKYYPDVWSWGTMRDNDKEWAYQRLMNYVGLIPGMNESGGDRVAQVAHSSTYTKVVNDGFLLTYPWQIGLNTILTIPSTHVCASAAKGTIWMQMTNSSGVLDTTGIPSSVPAAQRGNAPYVYNGETYYSNYYLTTYNNAAQIQTGNAAVATADEVGVIANTLYYLSQLTGETSLRDNAALDRAPPAASDISLDSVDEGGLYNIKVLAEDQGTPYQMYVVGKNQTNPSAPSFKSDIVEQESATGVKGYLHIISAAPGTEPAQTDPVSGKRIPEPVSGASNTLSAGGVGADGSYVITGVDYNQKKDYYLCVAAYDYAGNVGPVKSVKIGDLRLGIDVTVVNESGVPVGNASVIMNGQDMGHTNSSGKLSFNVRHMGTYTVMATFDGHAPGIVTATVDASNRITGVTITLRSTGKGVLWGLVTDDETGQPLPGAVVGTVAGQTAVTDDFGYYYITELFPGSYNMIASKEGYNSVPAFNVGITANRATRRDFTMTAKNEGNETMLIFGKVTSSETGSGIPTVNVTIMGTTAVVSDSFGCYVTQPIPTQTGDLPILATKKGFASYNDTVHTDGADTEYSFVMLQVEGGQIMVTVLDKDSGQPITGATVFISGQEQPVGETGTAVFQVPPYGTYYVMAQAPGYNYNASNIEVTVTSPDVYYLTIRMRPGNKGAVYGRVVDATTLEGVAGADVSSLIALSDPASIVKATTDSDGNYVIQDVTPGTYNMMARLLPAPNRYNPALNSVTVLPNSGINLDFVLQKNSTGGGTEAPHTIVWGQVTELVSPVEGADVRDRDDPSNTSLTDSFGFYVLTGYPHSTAVRLQADKGGSSATGTVTAKFPDVRKDFTLSSGG